MENEKIKNSFANVMGIEGENSELLYASWCKGAKFVVYYI